MEGTDTENSVVYDIAPENELRFVVKKFSTNVTLQMLSGFAEVLGSELVRHKTYTFLPPISVAVFTWKGCSVKLTGTAEKIEVTTEMHMIIPTYMHACLEEMRIKAELENAKGPISLIIGPTDAGKTTFCHILLNYAARLGRRPLYINLDVDQVSASVPGVISILPVEKPSDVTEGFDQDAVLVNFFGYTTPGDNVPLYFLQLKELGHLLQARLKTANQELRTSGAIIDTSGWASGHSYNANKLIASAFEIDVLFVLKDENLYFKVKKDMPSNVQVVFVPKQGGALERNKSFRVRNRDNRIWDYFYGIKTPLLPYTFDVKFSEILIYKVTQVRNIINSQNISYDDIDIVQVPLGYELVYHILGLSCADTTDKKLIGKNVKGFVCVVDVIKPTKVVTLLSPQPYPLPSSLLIMGNIKLK